MKGQMKASQNEEKFRQGEIAASRPHRKRGVIIYYTFFFVCVCVLGCVAVFSVVPRCTTQRCLHSVPPSVVTVWL